MALQEYHRKRNFHKTTEPRNSKRSTKSPTPQPLMFVIQEHHASHLHYDLRLEWKGVLKSWAIPKGPSLDPHTKRLAIQVEDHPLEYGAFEGVIPADEYGAGEVFIWDTGVWIPSGNITESFRKGHLEFELKGKKLKGQWNLIRTKLGASERKNQKQWLLIKKPDTLSSPRRSSRNNLHKAKAKTKSSTKTAAAKKPPPFIEPELAELSATPPSGGHWLHEIKFDGYRAQVHIKGSSIQILTRSGQNWSDRFPDLVSAFKQLQRKLKLKDTILDGEIVCLDDQGRSDFQLLQNFLRKQTTRPLFFYAFDLLFFNRQDLRALPLQERRHRLQIILQKSPEKIRFSEELKGSPSKILKILKRNHVEGLISKLRESPYLSGRNSNWIKVKSRKRQEFIVGGFTTVHDSPEELAALLLGVYKGSTLVYVGKVGTGFDNEDRQTIVKKLKPLQQTQSPFTRKSPSSHNVFWLKPQLSAEVSFNEWTQDKNLRGAVFHGFRSDKPVRDIHRENPIKSPQKVLISHPHKVIYSQEKITKMEIILYYQKISKWLLPYLANRPLLLHRFPEGSHGDAFFQKHLGAIKSPQIDEIPIPEKHSKRIYLSVHDLPGLESLLQLGAFEIHSWNSRSSDLEHPDQIVFDLDPGPQVSWQQICVCASRLRKLLQKLTLKSFVKLSGQKGLHVHIPIAACYSWEEVKDFSQALVLKMEQDHPLEYTSAIGKASRRGKIFIDYLRNARGSTTVVPYSLRVRPHSSVALPISWTELSKIQSSDEFDLRRALRRVSKYRKNPWRYFDHTQQRIEILDQLHRSSVQMKSKKIVHK